MARVWQLLRKTFVNRNFLHFCLLGVVNTFNDALFSHLAHYVMQENLAAVVGYALALTLAFFYSCLFIFRTAPSFKRYVRFVLSYIPNFLIYFAVTFVTINVLSLPQFWATVIAAAAGGPVTFLIIKLYAFGRGKEDEPPDRL